MMRRCTSPLWAASALFALATGCGDSASDMPPDTDASDEPAVVTQPAPYVVPFIGSGGFGFGHGSSFVGAAAPHGLVKLGPDTRGAWGTVRFLHYSGYWYDDDYVQGFSHMHLHGTGACDYGVLTVMPLSEFTDAMRQPAGYESKLIKSTETASPGYYAVTLERGQIRSELAATTRAAHHRYTYGAAVAKKALLFDLAHHLDDGDVRAAEIWLDPATRRLGGWLHSVGEMSRGFGGAKVYFAARSKVPWSSHLVYSDGSAPTADTKKSGRDVGAVLFFDGSPTDAGPAGEPLELQVGLSLVSEENAAANLDAELGTTIGTQQAVRATTAAAWDQLLQTVQISGGSRAERRMFYSSLYRAFLMPSTHSDSDGRYSGFDGKIHTTDGHRYVSDLSLWDTYRTLHPLYSLLAPTSARDSVRSLLAMAQQGGAFPKWPLAGGDSGSMIGAPAELVVADAYLKGVTDFDAEAAYRILRAAAADPTAPMGGRGGRGHVEDYMRLGYVPAYSSGSVSWTTEYARGDAALSGLARALGHTADADLFAGRAGSYRNLYDGKKSFLRARAVDGSFSFMAYDPQQYKDEYVEANGWQSLWMNDHDADGLAMVLGGRAAAIDKLSTMFAGTQEDHDAAVAAGRMRGAEQPPYYWAGNETDVHAPYLFAQWGRPDLTARWVRWLMDTQYSDKPDGLPGNDDGGTMSAWYVFSALGIYPIVGTDRYVLGAPRFPRVVLTLPPGPAGPGGPFTIEAPAVSADKPYVTAITLDGVPLTEPTLRHAQLRPGATLHFTMSAQPPPPR